MSIRRLHPEIKEQWVAALRSGEYQQGKSYLTRFEYDGDGTTRRLDCCLGVLCDLAVQAGVVDTVEREDDLIGYAYSDVTGVPPRQVTQWAYGLADDEPGSDTWTVEWRFQDPTDPDDEGHLGTKGLYDLNDQDGLSFAEIADVIEREL